MLRKGDWRRLPQVGQRMLARYTLTGPFVQALSAVLVPIGLYIGIFVDVPVGVALGDVRCRWYR